MSSSEEYQSHSDDESKNVNVSHTLDDFDGADSDSENEMGIFPVKRLFPARDGRTAANEDDDEIEYDDEEIDIEDEDIDTTQPPADKENSHTSKMLSAAKLEKEKKRIKKSGVCYLSRVPPYMKPAKLRSALTRFGKIDRLFLKPEDTSTHTKRVKYGGNKKKNFTEGWIEFVRKKDAKLCATTLNGNILGGKKTSYYYDDVMNIKYLSGFKWHDLTQQIATENEVRQAKFAMELAQQQKMDKTFAQNVETSTKIKHIQKKRKLTQKPGQDQSDEALRRNFEQRKVRSTRSEADEGMKEASKPNEKLNGVLSRVF